MFFAALCDLCGLRGNIFLGFIRAILRFAPDSTQYATLLKMKLFDISVLFLITFRRTIHEIKVYFYPFVQPCTYVPFCNAGKRSNSLRDPLAQFLFQLFRRLSSLLKRDEGRNRLPFQLIRTAHRRLPLRLITRPRGRFNYHHRAEPSALKLSTSSTRPMIQKYPSLSRRAPSPVKYLPESATRSCFT